MHSAVRPSPRCRPQIRRSHSPISNACWHSKRTAGTFTRRSPPATPGFVLLDVRSPDRFGEGHVPGAVNLPHGRITERNLAEYALNTLFVVYCAGPHCNGADKAAVRLARLGRPVKKMIGGIEGWKHEGFRVAQ